MPKRKKFFQPELFHEREQTVIDLLKQDHDTVRGLLKAYEKADEKDQKYQIIEEVTGELNVHTALEEELFYPALRRLLHDQKDLEILDEALEEHHIIHLLVSELETLGPGGEHYNAKFKVLTENVEHHLQEEEAELFPKARKTAANSAAVVQKITQRKEELKKAFALI